MSGDGEDLGANGDIESLNKHLWNLLIKGTQNVSEEVVHEELGRNRHKIIQCLTTYQKKEPDKKLNIFQQSNSFRGGGDGGRSGGGDTLGLFEKKGIQSSTSFGEGCGNEAKTFEQNKETVLAGGDGSKPDFEKKLISEIAQRLNLTEECSKRIFSSFMVMEYKGGKTSYEKILGHSLSTFIKDLISFYCRERLCLIYCSQVILSSTLDEKHPYVEIFCDFVCSISMDEWCGSLCQSLKIVESDKEVIEIINTLALVLGHYSVNFEHTLSTFASSFFLQRTPTKNEDIMIAEAALFFVLLISGNSEAQDDSIIVTTLEKCVDEININPFMYPVYIAALADKCKGSEVIREKLKSQTSRDPKHTVNVLTDLVQHYSSANVKTRIGSIVLRSIFIGAENILATFSRENFGSNQEWFNLFSKLLRNSDISTLFLEEGYESMNQLYNDALTLFPMEIESILGIWRSITFNKYDGSSISTLISNLSRINFVAEPMVQIDTSKIRSRVETSDAKETQEYFLIEDRKTYGITIPASTRGIFIPQNDLVIWHLHEPCDKSFWAVLYSEILEPASRQKTEASSRSDCYIDPSFESHIFAIADFLIDYSKNADFAPNDLRNLINPVAAMLKIYVSMKADSREKGKCLAKLLEVIEECWKFSPNVIDLQGEWFWPQYKNANLIGEFILSHESTAHYNYNVTKGYVKVIQSLMRESFVSQKSQVYNELCSQSTHFVIENILPAYTQWRIPSSAEKHEILKETCELLRLLFQKGEEWCHLKDFAKSALLANKSPIFGLFEISEEELQDGSICPNNGNSLLPKVFNSCMNLLLETFIYDSKSGKEFGKFMGLDLVFKLGRLARHRLNSNIPILAMKMLKNISEEMPKSFLGCLGKETESFRELIIQRLEYKSEDIKLKIAILEFLTVSCQTQPGLTNQFFNESVLADFLLDLISEKDEELSVAILGFVRALLGLGNSLIRKCKTNDIWKKIFLPSSKMDIGGDIRIIEYTFHLISFELFSFGVSNPEFSACLSRFFKDDFRRLLLISISENNEELKRRSLQALKHMITLLLSKTDVNNIFTDEVRGETLEIIEEKFWEEKCSNESPGFIKAPLAELLLMLVSYDKNPQFLSRLTFNLSNSFDSDFVGVQLPLLALIKKCIESAETDVDSAVLECIIRIVSNILSKTPRLFENEDPKHFAPILTSASALISSLINSEYCKNLEPLFNKHLILYGILSVASLGITRELGPEIVLQCLGVLIELSKRPHCSEMLCHASISKYLWLPVAKYTSAEADPLWSSVYLFCLQLNATLVKSHRYFYLEDCLNYWGIHGYYIANKLWSLSQVVDRCYINNADKNFSDLTQLLSFIHIVLSSISMMLPFLAQWALQQPDTVEKIMEGVYTCLRTCVELLSQPKHLHVLIVKSKAEPDFKLTPQILEIQTKLWNVTGMTIHIFWKLRGGRHKFIDNGQLLTTLYALVAMCVKSLTKGDKKSNPSSLNVPSRVFLTLEKSLDVLFFRGNLALSDPRLQSKEQLALKREIATEIAVLCESIKRISGKDIYIDKMCQALEESFK